MPGCLIAFITLILLPIFYLRYKMWQLTRRMKKNNPFYSKRYDDEEEVYEKDIHKEQSSSRKRNENGVTPHIIKPNEGEYIDFTEEKDSSS